MLIQINDVSVGAVKTYQVATVSYQREGKDEVKKVFSFGISGDCFKQLAGLKSFPVNVNVQLVKEKGYWNWKAIEVSGDTNAATPSTATALRTGSTGRVTGSNYETPEERARRQVYIIRQSSISSAIELVGIQAKAKPDVSDIIEIAKEFEAYVMESGSSLLADSPV